jgi:hypothetical protein
MLLATRQRIALVESVAREIDIIGSTSTVPIHAAYAQLFDDLLVVVG